MRDVAEATLACLARGERAALATVIRTSGSTPQTPGARLLLTESGRSVGTVGGGAIEWAVLEELRRCLQDEVPRVMRRDLGVDLGMCCGGRMEIFVEPIVAPARLILCGAGHVAEHVASIARTVGFVVTVVDEREALNGPEHFPGCEHRWLDPADAVQSLKPTALDWILIMTHDHRLDEEALAAFGREPHRYLGLIGSRRKVLRILQRLAARGRLPQLDRVYAPVGLDLGGVTPQEIAVSVVAELIALRHGRTTTPHLRVMDDPQLAKAIAGSFPELPESSDP